MPEVHLYISYLSDIVPILLEGETQRKLCAESHMIRAKYSIQDLNFLSLIPRYTSLKDIFFVILCSIVQEHSKAPALPDCMESNGEAYSPF